jgi:hypothetical protein
MPLTWRMARVARTFQLVFPGQPSNG